MNRTKIEYVDYVWNPIVGCKHGCWYCYAERMNKRFKFIETWKEPKYFYHRLNEPSASHALRKKPQRILVCSMADLFGDWVDSDFIKKVVEQAQINSQHTFLFLTKKPRRYAEFEFPPNCWLGTTVENLKVDQTNRLYFLNQVEHVIKWVSFEPLLGKVSFTSDVNWIVIGAMTGTKQYAPKKEWIECLLETADKYNTPVCMKDNLKPYWDGEWRRELP